MYSNYYLCYIYIIYINNIIFIYSILFFIISVTKIHRDELDTILIILEKLLTLCPEIVAQRWQCHSLCMIITKLLHPENSWRLRRDGIK